VITSPLYSFLAVAQGSVTDVTIVEELLGLIPISFDRILGLGGEDGKVAVEVDCGELERSLLVRWTELLLDGLLPPLLGRSFRCFLAFVVSMENSNTTCGLPGPSFCVFFVVNSAPGNKLSLFYRLRFWQCKSPVT
jgi:hypothetical protein